MAIHSFRPLTPAGRFTSLNKREGLSKKRPQKALTEPKPKTGGRNVYGRITTRHIGGGHKQLYRIIDFKRDILDMPATVEALEYDPNRTSNLALVVYANGEKKYILAPEGLQVGAKIFASNKATTNDYNVGNNFPLHLIPPSTRVHAVELVPGRGAKIARAAGTGLELVAVEGDRATLKMPSGELRLVNAKCRATIGEVGNGDHNNQSLGKAGRRRWLGVRPTVRGMVMNPVDHPNGGGQGKSKGGGGRQQLVSPWGQLAKGFPTRRRSKQSNAQIIVHHNGRKPRGKK
ncbi:50S ribosomal protein L2 [Opitutus terrae]|uniref:Large ribosomal subunit protein uL2 n=1 Tax=Opitutus terrae (strain DSM 11246 / JCM 15787 / PB90-1) TaxID=452637 RepID=RL2_OPITP|nr:50S ribosomal protein L2 [Opitutus terrae]B1ZNE5.1 RecName: Full=Large ribosomal subunit protein uL2; AltName: Full=50S ribosomal protein L2 [Opitutus terrae PB90-1]ACB73514.1 ribosomal protein L2 [Opitutus terrae PB90-1]